MDCRAIERNLSAYLDDELAPASRDAFFDHLALCDACRDRVGEATWLEASLANAMKRPMVAPASIRYNVLSALHRDAVRRQPARRGFAWRPAAAMAAVLALGSAGWRTFTGALQPAPTIQTEAQPAPRTVASLPPEMAKPAAPAVEKPAPAQPRPAAHVVPVPKPPAPHHAAPKAPPVTVARADAAPAPAPRPSQQRAAPPQAAPPAPELPVGTVTSITAPPDVVSARFLARPEGKRAWQDASRALHAKTRLQSGDETIVTMTLNDGTVLKSNQHTEFVVLRSPGKEDPSWGIRLIRGELWVKSSTPVNVTTPSLQVRAENAEFSVRSMDGEDAAVMAVAGTVTASNDQGSADVSAGQATSAPAGAAPEAAFQLANPKGQLDWAYAAPDAK